MPAVIRNIPDEAAIAVALIENIQRENLNPIEEARAYKQMLDRLEVTQEELARRVGKDRSSLANTMRLLQLPREIQEVPGFMPARIARLGEPRSAMRKRVPIKSAGNPIHNPTVVDRPIELGGVVVTAEDASVTVPEAAALTDGALAAAAGFYGEAVAAGGPTGMSSTTS